MNNGAGIVLPRNKQPSELDSITAVRGASISGGGGGRQETSGIDLILVSYNRKPPLAVIDIASCHGFRVLILLIHVCGVERVGRIGGRID